jgi:CHAT domain-containing protein
MTLSRKKLLVIMIAAILHGHVFSQGNSTALSFYNSGAALVSKNPEQAFHLLEKAMNIAQKNKDWDLYLKSINALASVDFDGRSELQDQVFEWAIGATNNLKGVQKTDELAQLHFNLGNFYSDLTNEIDQPINHFQIAKGIWVSLHGEWHEKVANCYHSIGDISKYKKNDFHEAENSYERALQIREKINLQNLNIFFRNYYSLAQTNSSQGDFEKALSYATKTLEIAKKLNGTIYQETTHGVLAGIYRDMGESLLANQHFNIAIALNKKTNLKNLAWYYQGLGETLRNDSQYDEAIKNLKRAHTIYVRERINPGLLVYLLELIADTYFREGDEQNFYKTTRELFVAFDSLGMMRSRQASQGLMILGNFHFSKNDYDSALYYYQNALISSIHLFNSMRIEDNPTENMIGYQYYVYGILAKKAAALKAKFMRSKDPLYWHQAIACLRLSERLLSQERNTLDMQDAKWQLTEAKYDIYEDIIDLLYEDNEYISKDSLYNLAFQYFERSKSRSLTDALAEAERSTQIAKGDSLLNLHATLRRNLLAAQDKLSTELERNSDSKKIVERREEIISIDKAIHACKLSIEQKYPGYFNVKYGYQPTSLEKLQKLIVHDKKIMLEYFWGKQWVYALGISDGDILFKRIGSTDSIKLKIDALLSHLSGNHAPTNREVFKAFTDNAHHLYEILIDPFKILLVDQVRVQIIPDGSIGQLPVEILITEKVSGAQVNYRSPKYMIKSYSIGYAYSSSMLIHNSRKSFRNPSLLAVGLAEVDGLEKIEGAEKELGLLSKHFNAGRFLVGDDATEGNFKALSPNFNILHLAIHGTGDMNKNFAASLYFESKRDSLEDGELHAYELYGLKLRASMAVLTACESGLGKGYRGEGMISMASAFTYSGCQNVLMSLWKVNDQVSIGIMDHFYDRLEQGATIDDALRLSKLSYLESSDELTADPKVWATMVAYGTLDKVFHDDKSGTYKAMISIALLLLLLFMFLRNNR